MYLNNVSTDKYDVAIYRQASNGLVHFKTLSLLPGICAINSKLLQNKIITFSVFEQRLMFGENIH